MTSLPRATAAAVLALAVSTSLAACSGGDDEPGGGGGPEGEPTEVLAAAKERLDSTSGVELTLSTDDEPATDAFLSEATGVITADPAAFEGTASGTFSGLPASDVQIVAVDDVVHANLFGDFTEFDLPDCVPDPSGLLGAETGFSTVLTAATDVSEGDSVRGGADNDQVLTTYTGTVPGTAVQNILPCAPGEQFDATFTVDDDGALTSADLTGEFFEGTGEITYAIDVTAYDVDEEITAP
jgi:lipoprotein LprG